MEIFPDTIDVYLQAETMGKSTWRRLRNTSDLKSSLEARARIESVVAKVQRLRLAKELDEDILPFKLNPVCTRMCYICLVFNFLPGSSCYY